MKKRIVTTTLIWATLLASLYFFGAAAGVWLLLLLTLFALHELFGLLEALHYRPLRNAGLVCASILILGAYYLPGSTGEISSLLLAFIFCFFSLCLLYRPSQSTWLKQSIMPTFWALLCIPYCLQFYIALFRKGLFAGSPTMGLLIVLWVIAVAKFTDVGGLLVGCAWGRHKLAPNISPNKTWEGLMGGLVMSSGIGIVFFLLTQGAMPEKLTITKCILFSLIIGIVSVLSDLFESVLKRLAGIKDSGRSLPGIGGAFDLLDSLLFVGPVAYALFSYLL